MTGTVHSKRLQSVVSSLSDSLRYELRAFTKWLVAKSRAARKERADREAFDLQSMADIVPILEAYHDAVVAPDVDCDPETITEFLDRIEHTALRVRAKKHAHLRDMLENLVLFDNYRNEYYLRSLSSQIQDLQKVRNASNS